MQLNEGIVISNDHGRPCSIAATISPRAEALPLKGVSDLSGANKVFVCAGPDGGLPPQLIKDSKLLIRQICVLPNFCKE